MITQNDFSCIGSVAKHCDLAKLSIAIEEAKNFDLIPLFCFGFVDDVLKNWTNEAYQSLINGGAFNSCNGKPALNHGLKKVWVYYAYAHYLLINRMNDTPNGMVGKTNDFSIPTPLEEITDFSNKYRAMGKKAFLSVQQFLCHHKQNFPKFESQDCKDCECKECKGGETKKITGIRYTIIRR